MQELVVPGVQQILLLATPLSSKKSKVVLAWNDVNVCLKTVSKVSVKKEKEVVVFKLCCKTLL